MATTVNVSPGDDLYRLAAQYYSDASAWTLIAAANGLSDPLIQTSAALTIPPYNTTRANQGIFVVPQSGS
jgi:nucleoid-associated protein YgaU